MAVFGGKPYTTVDFCRRPRSATVGIEDLVVL